MGHNNPTSLSQTDRKRDPKSMVIRIGAGEIGPSVSQLVADLRRVMEPGTASRLKERRANKLRDYVTMCGPLGVTHLLLFSRSAAGNTNMRLAVTPRGPTLHFKVENYTLAKDVQKSQRRPRGGGNEYITAPLLVMNNFSTSGQSTPKHLESLVTTMFQSLFPPINPQTTSLRSIQRIILLNREPTSQGMVLKLRHFAITTKNTAISRPVRRLDAATRLQRHGKGLPNLGKMQDISDFMIGNSGEGYMTDATSASELDSDAEVEVLEAQSRKISGRRKTRNEAVKAERENEEADITSETEGHVEKKAIKLVELGPRLKLRLGKVEEGLCGGKVMWHEYIHKSQEEIKDLEKRWNQKRQEKEARKQQQKENVEKKRKERDDKKASGRKADGSEDDEMDIDMPEDLEDLADMNEFYSDGMMSDAEKQVNEKMEEDEWEPEND